MCKSDAMVAWRGMHFTRYEVVGFRRASDAKFERYAAQVGNRPMFYRVPADELDSIGLLDG